MLIETKPLASYFQLEPKRWIPLGINEHHGQGLTNVEVGLISRALAEMVIAFPTTTLRFFRWVMDPFNEVEAIPEFVDRVLESYKSPSITEWLKEYSQGLDVP